MKKYLYPLFSALLLLCAALTTTSCEEEYNDFDQSIALNGIWQGTLSTDYYYDNYGSNTWQTEFRFAVDREGATSGTGIEIDYNPMRYQDYRYYNFRWMVVYGNIFLYFENGESLVIRDYRMNNQYLEGYLETNEDNPYLIGRIRLTKTSYWPWDDALSRATSNKNIGGERVIRKTE